MAQFEEASSNGSGGKAWRRGRIGSQVFGAPDKCIWQQQEVARYAGPGLMEVVWVTAQVDRCLSEDTNDTRRPLMVGEMVPLGFVV